MAAASGPGIRAHAKSIADELRAIGTAGDGSLSEEDLTRAWALQIERGELCDELGRDSSSFSRFC